MNDRLAGEKSRLDALASEPSRLEEFWPAFTVDDDGVVTVFDPAEIAEAEPEPGILNGKLRISIGTIGCRPEECTKEDADGRAQGRTPLAVIISQVTSTRDVANPRKGQEKQPDTFLALVGQHEAMNIQKGTAMYGMRFRSGVLYLPSDLNTTIGDQFRELVGPTATRARPGEWRGIQFAMQIFSEPSGNLAGYTYSWRPLAKTGLPDPLAALRHEAMALLAVERRLEAPRPVEGDVE